ncbi:MAG: N-acetylglucosamine-6-phosphate deacetylase [Chloroflexota bacterium]
MDRPTAIAGITVLGGTEGPVAIRIEGDRIAAIGAGAGAAADATTSRFDGAGLLAAPGFIDLQINGASGHDLTTDPESLWAVGEALPRYGVTTFLPTIVSAVFEVAERARRVLLAGPPEGYAGATPLGLHVEGPFLSPERAGAHDPAALQLPDGVDRSAVSGWSPATGVRMVTLAPELAGALDLVRELAAAGVVVSAGHSSATWDEARAGFDAGIRSVTHLFNAMGPLDHRDPGLVGAALADPRVTVGLIADGIHVHPAMVELAQRVLGPDRLALVTDAIAALGMGPGRYRLGAKLITCDEDSARLEDGVLAGSVLTLDGAVRNLVAFAGCSIEDAIAAVTLVPARLLRLDANDAARSGDSGRGSRDAPIRAGGRANLTILSPDLHVVATVVGGRVSFIAEGEASRWA